MSAITVTDKEVRIDVDSWIKPFAQILRDTHLPDGLLIHWGSGLIHIVSQLNDIYGMREAVLTEIGLMLLHCTMEYSIVLQKGLSGHAEVGATMTGTLSSE